MVGGHAQPKPSQNLEKQGKISSPSKSVPYRGEVPRELKAALGGKGAGVKAVLTAQPEKKSRRTYP